MTEFAPRHAGRIAAIIDAAAAEYRSSPLLIVHGRKRPVAHARQICMKLARDRTGASYPTIGRVFGKHHTTVIQACRNAEVMLAEDPWARRVAERIGLRADLILEGKS